MDRLTEQERVRLAKLAEIKQLGFTPYLTDRLIDSDLEGIVREYQGLERDRLEELGREHQVAGRLMSIRSRFLVIRQEGVLLQLYLSDSLDSRERQLAGLLDIGDII